MKKSHRPKAIPLRELLLLLGMGSAAGFVNGFFGTGGGGVLIFGGLLAAGELRCFGKSPDRRDTPSGEDSSDRRDTPSGEDNADRPGAGTGGDPRDLFAGTAAVTLVLSAVSAAAYQLGGGLPFGASLRYCLPALLGGGIGALLLDRMPVRILNRIFAAVVITAGGLLLLR